MLTVIWKFIRSIFGTFLRLLYPLKRVVCRRRKLSNSSEPFELTSIGTGDSIQVPHSFGGFQQEENEAEIEMEAWDSWGSPTNDPSPIPNYSYPPEPPPANPGVNGHVMNNQTDRKPPPTHTNFYNKKAMEPEPEPEINFFEDMTPAVKKQKKFLVRKKEQSDTDMSSGLSSRLAMAAAVPPQTPDLDTWDDNENAWGSEEAAEDLTWQAEEAIREKKRMERMERQMEQQKRKQKREELRGMKGSGHLATKIS